MIFRSEQVKAQWDTWAYCYRGMLEFDLDDQLIECHTMGCPDAEQIRLGVCGAHGDAVTDLRIWSISLEKRR